MKKIFGRLLVLILTLTMLFSMTSCDMVLEILDILLSEEYEDPDKRDVKVLADESPAKDPQNPYSGLHSGYNVIPASKDGYVWEVENYYEVDRVFDYALANLLESVTIDFGTLLNGYSDFESFFKNEFYLTLKKSLSTSRRINGALRGALLHLHLTTILLPRHIVFPQQKKTHMKITKTLICS